MTELTKRLREVLQKLTYKPGWTFRLLPSGDFDTVVIDAVVPDVMNPNNLVSVRSAVRFSPYDHDYADLIIHKIKSAIRELEYHEMQEWLREDGVPVDDPHPEKKGVHA